MEKWKKITYMIAFYLFLTELRPLDAYMSAYLTRPDGKISLYEVASVIEAIKSYSALVIGVLMLVTADYLLYKPNIIFVTAWPCLSYALMTGWPSVMQLRVSTVGLGAMYSSSILAYSYMYAQIEDANKFQIATSIVAAAVQLGRVTGDLLAQIIVNVTKGSYTILPYITAFSLFLGTIWACLLPSVENKNNLQIVIKPNEKSSLLVRNLDNVSELYEKKHEINELNKEKPPVIILLKESWMNFNISISNPLVFKRCLWYIFGMGAYIEFIANVNVLYSYIALKSTNENVSSNGLAEAMVTICGAAGAYLIGKVQLDWTYYGDFYTAFCSFLMGALIMSCYFYTELYFIYVFYMLYSFIFQALLVIILSEIAKGLEQKCYSLILVFIYIASVIIVSILTLFLIQFNFMRITVPGRFLFIGGIYVLLGFLFLFNSIFETNKHKTLC